MALPVASSDLLLLASGFTTMGLGIKMILASLAARATGLAWGESLELGALLQCKGLMEIVTLVIMHDAKIISTQIFFALIVMALLCTILTVPMRPLLGKFRNHGVSAEKNPANESKTTQTCLYRIQNSPLRCLMHHPHMNYPCFHEIVALGNKSMTGIKRFGCDLGMQYQSGVALPPSFLK